MNKIYFLGDIHTANAFRLAGLEVIVTGPDRSAGDLDRLLKIGDAAVILMTTQIAETLKTEIYETNLNRPYPVVLEIPDISDTRGFQTSLLDYITEALGMSI